MEKAKDAAGNVKVTPEQQERAMNLYQSIQDGFKSGFADAGAQPEGGETKQE